REKTQGGVFVGLGVKLAPLRAPHAMAVMQSVTEEERERGIREIDLYDLRKPGTAIYAVIPEGDATRYRIVLTILFGLASSIVRKTSNDTGAAPVLLALDEAGNIPIHNLSEMLGVGRGRRCGIVLGYQNIGQLNKQHGRDGANAILGSVGTMVFLPGLDSETALYAARRIGRTTVLQHTSVDAPGSNYDNERQSEAGRDLLDAAELRQMVAYEQAVAITGTAPPVMFGFPPCRKGGRISHPLHREVSRPPSLKEAEEAFAKRKAEEANRQEHFRDEAIRDLSAEGFRTLDIQASSSPASLAVTNVQPISLDMDSIIERVARCLNLAGLTKDVNVKAPRIISEALSEDPEAHLEA
ncbi:MAG TPA: TraG/TraD/VirD4 family protein, partial [Blastocatellia bacterium]